MLPTEVRWRVSIALIGALLAARQVMAYLRLDGGFVGALGEPRSSEPAHPKTPPVRECHFERLPQKMAILWMTDQQA